VLQDSHIRILLEEPMEVVERVINPFRVLEMLLQMRYTTSLQGVRDVFV
jgi:hypothetical protein